jgi:lipoprotein-releasing system ATP-binding protein
VSELLLEIRGLSKHFKTEAEDLAVLEDLDLLVTGGESVAISGASGSGKSTLLSLIGGLDRASGGMLRAGPWLLHDLEERRLAEYRASFIGFVFQFHYLIRDFTALENVALPAMMRGLPKAAAMRAAEELLGGLGLEARLHHLPAKLSGGERQRTAIARALINRPALLIADEPTGNLDAVNARAVSELLYSLPARFQTTLVIATHDPDLAAGASTRYHLADGNLTVS